MDKLNIDIELKKSELFLLRLRTMLFSNYIFFILRPLTISILIMTLITMLHIGFTCIIPFIQFFFYAIVLGIGGGLLYKYLEVKKDLAKRNTCKMTYEFSEDSIKNFSECSSKIIEKKWKELTLVYFNKSSIVLGFKNQSGLFIYTGLMTAVQKTDLLRFIENTAPKFTNAYLSYGQPRPRKTRVLRRNYFWITSLVDTTLVIIILLNCLHYHKYKLTAEQINSSLRKNMVFVKGGYMSLTNDSNRLHNKISNVHSFYISKYMVTFYLWKSVIDTDNLISNDSANYPVRDFNASQIDHFIKKLNLITGGHYRLPTDSEFVYAQEGGQLGKGYVYSGSNDPYEVAWYDRNSHKSTHPVGQMKANELGLYDMSGNLSERVTGYDNNSAMVVTGESHIFTRGGAFDMPDYNCKINSTGIIYDTTHPINVGFRLVEDTNFFINSAIK